MVKNLWESVRSVGLLKVKNPWESVRSARDNSAGGTFLCFFLLFLHYLLLNFLISRIFGVILFFIQK